MSATRSTQYGQRYEEALSYAARLHATQVRKTDDVKPASIPYVAHLLEVSSLVWMGGGDEDQAVAGLLHDAIEDQSDCTSPAELERRFGPRVRAIVLACSDGAPDMARDGSTWLDRKVSYLAALHDPLHADAMVVTVADKISNARAILDDLLIARASADPGSAREALWGRFNAPRQAIAWYYAEVLVAARVWNPDNALVTRLVPLVDRLVVAAGGDDIAAALGLSDDELRARTAPLDRVRPTCRER
jgi:hypothetical protein